MKLDAENSGPAITEIAGHFYASTDATFSLAVCGDAHPSACASCALARSAIRISISSGSAHGEPVPSDLDPDSNPLDQGRHRRVGSWETESGHRRTLPCECDHSGATTEYTMHTFCQCSSVALGDNVANESGDRKRELKKQPPAISMIAGVFLCARRDSNPQPSNP
jgi:hypothetical protein